MKFLVISSAKKTQTVHVNDRRASYTTPFYCEYTVADFKAAVPWRKRQYDRSTHTWTCDIKYLDAITAMAERFGPVAIEVEKEGQP